MNRFHRCGRVVFLGGCFLLLAGCASHGGFSANGNVADLPLIPGEASLQMSKITTASLSLPAATRVASGSILKFSPFEFRSEKDRFSLDAIALPLGRYIAVRHSAEGITADLQAGEARSFDMHYDARYPDLGAARIDFPKLAKDRYHAVTVDGKPAIEIEQWHVRLTMIFSTDRQAFRVLLDNMEYTAPQPPAPQADEVQSVNTSRPLPVVVAFSYRHPDSATETLVQQNIFFEFKVANSNGGFHGTPQISGWVPLHAHAQTQPYTVGIIVAEIHENTEEFYKKLFDFVKSVRGII